jgi:hypothetical protein
MDIFARIYKIDESTRTVTGRAAQEVLDRSNEIMDYKKSKPFFQRWSAECFQDSGGRSHGNVREMHSNIAAGKLTSIAFDDTEHAIDVEAQIVDDGSWAKCLAGVFTGFSIGGAYQNKTQDILNGKMVTRYTAAPSEISLVDRPCIPSALFEVTKRDGTVMRKHFQNSRTTFKSSLEFSGGIVKLSEAASKEAFKKIYAQGGPLPFTGDFMGGRFAPNRTLGNDPVAKSIRRAHKDPLPTTIQMDALGLSKAFEARRLRKGSDAQSRRLESPAFPPQSRNAISDGAIASTGASNNWHDQTWDPPKPTIFPRVMPKDVSHSANLDAVTAAIKRDLARGAKRIGV